MRIADIDVGLIRNYTSMTHKFLKDLGKQDALKNLSVPDIVQMTLLAEDREVFKRNGINLLAMTTVKHCFPAVRDFLSWVATRYPTTGEIGSNLSSIVTLAGKAKSDKRVPFTLDDLKMLFQSQEYK